MLELILKGKRLGFTLAEIELLMAAGTNAGAAIEGDVVRRFSLQQVKDKLALLERQREALETSLGELCTAFSSQRRHA